MGVIHARPDGGVLHDEGVDYEHGGEFPCYGCARYGGFWGEGGWLVVGWGGVDGRGVCYCGEEGLIDLLYYFGGRG